MTVNPRPLLRPFRASADGLARRPGRVSAAARRDQRPPPLPGCFRLPSEETEAAASAAGLRGESWSIAPLSQAGVRLLEKFQHGQLFVGRRAVQRRLHVGFALAHFRTARRANSAKGGAHSIGRLFTREIHLPGTDLTRSAPSLALRTCVLHPSRLGSQGFPGIP